MRYMITISTVIDDARQAWRRMRRALDEAHRALAAGAAGIRRAGRLRTSSTRRMPPSSGTYRGKTIATRGPFTEGTEIIGGYYIVDVAGRERAVEIAGRLAETRFSPIEIRRMMH